MNCSSEVVNGVGLGDGRGVGRDNHRHDGRGGASCGERNVYRDDIRRDDRGVRDRDDRRGCSNSRRSL